MKSELLGLVASRQAQTSMEVKLQCEVLELLINTKSFQFPPGLGQERAVTRLWEVLVDKNPPGLHTLVVTPNIQQIHQFEQLVMWDVRAFFERMVSVFVHLEVLKLQCLVCEDDDLTQIAHHLPKLR
jgi:hypothetical protein